MFIQILLVILCLQLNHVAGKSLSDLCPDGECSKDLQDRAEELSKNESISNKKCVDESDPNCILDAAVDLIYEAKKRTTKVKNMDCGELLSEGFNISGIFTIWPRSRVNEGKPVNIYCDMETDGGGWTVIQRRGDFGTPSDYFHRSWLSYKYGFGDMKQEFWLGNDNIFTITNQRVYSARVDLKAVDGETGYALYEAFWIDDESRNYTLHIHNYSGNAGKKGYEMEYNDNGEFSTKDRRKDSCAESNKGGWWYRSCSHVFLNSLYLPGEKRSDCARWNQFKVNECLKSIEIKIRPKNFRKNLDS